MALHRRYPPPHPGKYIIHLKLSTKSSQWKLSGWLVCDLERLELTVITGHFGLIFRQAYRKVSKQASKQAIKQASMQVRRSKQASLCSVICNWSW